MRGTVEQCLESCPPPPEVAAEPTTPGSSRGSGILAYQLPWHSWPHITGQQQQQQQDLWPHPSSHGGTKTLAPNPHLQQQHPGTQLRQLR